MVIGIVLLIIRKEKWAGIIVAGLSIGIGFYILLAGLNLATINLLQNFSNPSTFSDFGSSSNNYDDEFTDDYINVKYGETATLDDESLITINKPTVSREETDYDIYEVKVKVENPSTDDISFSSEDVYIYDQADDDYGDEITENKRSN
ncbi:conserved hypothetical protein, partial [Listeria seeligeri FSL S4-171]